MNSDTTILIESQGDNIVCAKNAKEFEEYTFMIFNKLIDGNKNIPEIHDARQIPTLLPVGDFFVIKRNETEKNQGELDWKVSITLYVIYEKEKGWLRSHKVKRGRELKTITGTCVDMFIPAIDDSSVGSSKEDDTTFSKKLKDLPGDWMNHSHQRNFVNKMCDIDCATKTKMIVYVQSKMYDVERTKGKENKVKLILDIFNKLAEPEGKQFAYSHFNFYNICRTKMIEFYNYDNVKELGPLFEQIFEEPMPTTI